jgi:ketol-acid reductoisomerase
LKLIVDLIHTRGLAGMRAAISDTAEYGDYTRGPRVVDDRVRAEMRRILDEVQSGAFAKEWMAENAAGRPRHGPLSKRDQGALVEVVGARLRAGMRTGATT